MPSSMAIYPRVPILAEVNSKIATHAGLPWVHPWQRSPLLKYQLKKSGSIEFALPGAGGCRCCCFDGKYIWMGREVANDWIIRFDPADESYSYVEIVGMSDINAMCYDGSHVWFVDNQSPARYAKINPNTMAYTVWTLPTGYNKARSASFDETYVWIGLNLSPAKALKIDPADGSYTEYGFAAGENNCRRNCFDGSHVWQTLSVSPGKVAKINPADGSYTTYTFAAGRMGQSRSVLMAATFGLAWELTRQKS